MDVSNYLRESLDIWNIIRGNKINVTSLENKVKKNLAALEMINEKWTAILPFLPFHRQWRVYYQNYCEFALNEKPHQRNNEEADCNDDHKLNTRLEALGNK